MQDNVWIREVVPYGKSKYKIIPESASPFVLYKGEVAHYGIKEGSPVSSEDYEEIRKLLERRGKSRAMYLLEKKDYTTFQMRRKLMDSFYPEDIVEKVLSFLQEMHYLDDRRYASHYVQYHSTEWNKRQLKQKLMEKGIKADAAEEALEGLEGPSEEELARKLLEKRHFDREGADEKEKQKMARYLMGKGYSFDIIRHLVL